MTSVAFFGYLLLSCGPPLATWVAFIWPSSFLVLTAITSMFSWLTIMLLISAIFRAFVPLDTVGAYAAVIIVSVLVEEIFRLVSFKLHTVLCVVLRKLAQRGQARFTTFDEIKISYSVGWGHGMTHVLFQFLPFLPMAWRAPTFYNENCPEMSVFLVSSLSQLGMFYLLSGCHVVFIWGTLHRKYWISGLVPLIHLLVALVSLVNFDEGGCLTSVPIFLMAGILVVSIASALAWSTATQPQSALDAQLPINRHVGSTEQELTDVSLEPVALPVSSTPS